MQKSIIDMMADIKEYYENAGFADFNEKMLKNASDDEIRKTYHKPFEEKEDIEAEDRR